MSSFSQLSSPDENCWFLSIDDYSALAQDAFAWNEFEILSLDASSSDDERAMITTFWSRHVPILLSVRDGYSYLAVRDDGVIIHGEEPEFEQTTLVAASLDELLRAFVDGSAPTPLIP